MTARSLTALLVVVLSIVFAVKLYARGVSRTTHLAFVAVALDAGPGEDRTPEVFEEGVVQAAVVSWSRTQTRRRSARGPPGARKSTFIQTRRQARLERRNVSVTP